MNCNLNLNNSNTSFQAIYSINGAKQLLDGTLNKAERMKLREFIDAQADNPIAIMLAKHSGKRLDGWIAFQEVANGKYHRKDYTQRMLFDSPLKFIKRLCEKADNLRVKYDGDINLHNGEILDLLNIRL